MIWCEQRIGNAKSSACAEQITLCCDVCLLAVSRSDRQYVRVKFSWEKRHGDRERSNEEQAKEYTTTDIIPGTAACSKEIRAQHDTARQRRAKDTAPHGAALRCWAVCSWANLSWACIVIHHRSTWYVQTWCSSTGT